MKIEWLDKDFEKAKVTKGWFRKRYAIVELRPTLYGWYWKYPDTNEWVSEWLDWRLRAARRKAIYTSPWKPVEQPKSKAAVK